MIHISDYTFQSLKNKHARGMRNIVAHDYANVDSKIIWDVATAHVPEIFAVLEKFFARRS